MASKQNKGNKVDTKVVGKVDAYSYISANGYPEVGSFSNEKDIQRFYKQLSTDQVKDWANLEGLEYKPCPEHEAIDRMRVCMAILRKHFPVETKAATVSPYKQYSTEDLVQMALDNNVLFETTDDDRILRMRAIMALRAHNIIG